METDYEKTTKNKKKIKKYKKKMCIKCKNETKMHQYAVEDATYIFSMWKDEQKINNGRVPRQQTVDMQRGPKTRENEK